MDGPFLNTRLARDIATSLWNQKVTPYRIFLARHLVHLVYLVYLVCLVYLVLWLNETNQMNQINQIIKTNQVVERARGCDR
jgi:fumarate reductase subunit C